MWMIGCLLAEFLRCQVIRVKAGVGRRGGECVNGDMHLLGLKREWAQDRVKWRGLISGDRPTRASMEIRTLNR